LLWAGGFVDVVVVVGFVLVVVGFATRRVAALSQRVSERDREREYSTCVFRERERRQHMYTCEFGERRKMTTSERAESCSAHTLAHAHARAHCPRPRRTASWTLPRKKNASARRTRCSAEAGPEVGRRTGRRSRPVLRGTEDSPSARAREKVKATRKCSGEAREREQRVEFHFL
jgi:hypothetical protein